MNRRNLFKILILMVLCFGICTVLFGCALINRGQVPQENKNYTVTFKVDNATYLSDHVGSGYVSKPFKDPEKTNHQFVCWSTEKGVNKPFDFSTPIENSITLYAYFIFDEVIMQESVDKVSNSIVKVTNSYTENGERVTVEGVGIVYHVQNGYCYVVTNYHTVISKDNQIDPKIIVTDIEGNEFLAKVFKSKNKENPAIDENYDLAVVCFEYNDDIIKQYNTNDIIEYMGEAVIAVGSSNEVVAMGTVNEYKMPKSDINENLSKLNFEVYYHDAIPNSDVKETILFNSEMIIVGITTYSEDGVAYAIPTGRVAEFLNLYLYG